MKATMVRRIEKLEAAKPSSDVPRLVVGLPECIPHGYSGKVIITGVPRPGDGPEVRLGDLARQDASRIACGDSGESRSALGYEATPNRRSRCGVKFWNPGTRKAYLLRERKRNG